MAQSRINDRDLQKLCDELNKATGSPLAPWRTEEGRNRANIGNYHISHAYGGVCLHRMSNESGGVSTPLYAYHDTKRKLYDAMRAMLAGIELVKGQGRATE